MKRGGAAFLAARASASLPLATKAVLARAAEAAVALVGCGLIALGACAGARATRNARVSVRCDDADAELVVDGVPRGTAGDYAGAHRLLLTPGLHRLELRAHGAVETRALQVGSDDDVTLNIALGEGARAAAQGVPR